MQTRTTNPSKKGGGALAAAIAFGVSALITFPIAFGMYAHSRPASEATCEMTRDTIFATGEPVDVMTCRILGVEISRVVRNAETGAEVR